jgi:hypothetical protein
MSQYIAIRALHRSQKVRIPDVTSGEMVELQQGIDTIVDVDDPYTQRQLQRHQAIVGWYVTATNNNAFTIASGLVNLPANVAASGSWGGDQIDVLV